MLSTNNETPLTLPAVERWIEEQFAEDQARNKTYYCAVCNENIVSPADGEDTCPNCVGR